MVAASRRLAETSSRSAKVAILAELLGRLEPDEVAIAVGFLAGVPRQGRVGVGYRDDLRHRVPRRPRSRRSRSTTSTARSPRSRGPPERGPRRSRRQILGELLARATEPEADFIKRLFTGELRQGALAGLMVDAIAKAAGVRGGLARRALMLSGDLTRTAEIALTEGEEGLRAVGFEIFRPILPMLASTAASVAEAVGGFDRSSVEWKLDGIRIQIHRRDDEVRIYTRNLNEITDTLPGIVAAVRGLPVRAGGARRRGAVDGRARPGCVPGHRLADRQRGAAGGDRDLPLRRAPRRGRRPARHAAGGARRAARRDRAGAEDPERDHLGPRGGPARARRGARRRPRGRRREGRGVALLGGPARQGVAQGEAGAHLRPRGARRRVGPRAPPGLALEPPPRRARPEHAASS